MRIVTRVTSENRQCWTNRTKGFKGTTVQHKKSTI